MYPNPFPLTQPQNRMVQINSLYKNANSLSNSHFSIDFASRDLDKVRAVSVVKASLPRVFPNIWVVNNTIDIQHPLGIDNFFTIPPGQYDVTSLTAALNTATAGISVSWVWMAADQRFQATYGGVGSAYLISDPSLSTIANYIGLTSDVTLGAPALLPSPPDLAGPYEIVVNSSLVANTSCVAAGEQTYIPFVVSISFVDTPYGFVGRFDAQSTEIAKIRFPSDTCLRRIDIVLSDNFQNEISLPDNAFLDLVLQFDY